MKEYIRQNDIKVDKIETLLSSHIDGMEGRRLKMIADITEIVKAETLPLHKMLERQNESTGAFQDKIDAHIERVEPVIKAYEDTKIFNEELAKKGGAIIKTSATLGAIGSIWYLVIYGIR